MHPFSRRGIFCDEADHWKREGFHWRDGACIAQERERTMYQWRQRMDRWRQCTGRRCTHWDNVRTESVHTGTTYTVRADGVHMETIYTQIMCKWRYRTDSHGKNGNNVEQTVCVHVEMIYEQTACLWRHHVLCNVQCIVHMCTSSVWYASFTCAFTCACCDRSQSVLAVTSI